MKDNKYQFLQIEYGNMKRKKSEKKCSKFWKVILILFVIGLILGGIFFAILAKRYGTKRVIDKGLVYVTNVTSPILYKMDIYFNEKKGIALPYYNLDKSLTESSYFVDNKWYGNDYQLDINNIPSDNDVKQIIKTNDFYRLVNYPDGYYINLPTDLIYEFSLSKDYIKAYNENIDINISIDESPYYDTFEYINHYQNRFYLDANYQKENSIVINENKVEKYNGKNTSVLTLTRNTENKEVLNTYTYAYIHLHGRQFARVMIKSNEFNDEYVKTYTNILNSFTQIKKQGTSKYHIDLYPIKNENWGIKTTELYNKYTMTNNMDIGIFSENVFDTGINETIPKIEQEIERKFDVILVYHHLGNSLNTDSLNKMADDNRIIEFTLQTSYLNNEKLFGYTPIFDIIDGKKDDQIIELANNLKSLNTPILFRLNNEMNSDWTSYSGIIGLSDPDIYKQMWKRIYNIFGEQEVNNCIWIFNPNDNSFPPSKWNSFLSYYPGNEYVDMIGVTGYNTGTYYFKERGEVWREFETIYDEINEEYQPMFNKFPWIITEFASSSIGGDKIKWINNMFNVLPKYSNIKCMVWFNYADYDANTYDENTKNKKKVARPYWLDETPEALQEFKKGLESLNK